MTQFSQSTDGPARVYEIQAPILLPLTCRARTRKVRALCSASRLFPPSAEWKHPLPDPNPGAVKGSSAVPSRAMGKMLMDSTPSQEPAQLNKPRSSYIFQLLSPVSRKAAGMFGFCFFLPLPPAIHSNCSPAEKSTFSAFHLFEEVTMEGVCVGKAFAQSKATEQKQIQLVSAVVSLGIRLTITQPDHLWRLGHTYEMTFLGLFTKPPCSMPLAMASTSYSLSLGLFACTFQS